MTCLGNPALGIESRQGRPGRWCWDGGDLEPRGYYQDCEGVLSLTHHSDYSDDEAVKKKFFYNEARG
jgi:hypothetical protein